MSRMCPALPSFRSRRVGAFGNGTVPLVSRRRPVQIHLRCPRCPCHFSAPAETAAAEVLERMTDDAPWFALAEGDTFEEMVFAALQRRGRILCPECRESVLAGSEALAGLSAGDL